MHPTALSLNDDSESIVGFHQEFDNIDLLGDESELSILSDGEFKPKFCSTPIFPDSNSDMFSRDIFRIVWRI